MLLVLVGIVVGSTAIGEQLSDKAAAEQILGALPAGSSSAEAALVKGPVAEARRALERAAGARRSGDARHAEQLEGLAREWAETAKDVVRAAAVEADAGALDLAARDARVKSERARTLLEESIARRGRAEAELAKLTADAGLFPTQPPPATSARSKGGKTKGAP